ncbi:MAG: Glu/Leu/Phe/Val dehydrogenase, partial [Anderseniella sp.]|nr:Glu/Leu/Phe/Val dehydrogenase [Anderseniella sp.]
HIVGVDCDILIPAARPDVLTGKNADSVKAKLILQGANIPATTAAEEALHSRGILSVPDFIANAGGVICAAVEFHGGSEAAAFAEIDDKIRRNTREVLERAQSENEQPRTSATMLACERIRTAMSLRRWH